MSALGVDPQALVGVGGLSLVLFLIITAFVRDWLMTSKAHKREMESERAHSVKLVAAAEAHTEHAYRDRDEQVAAIRAEMTTRMENFRNDFSTRMQQAREDHDKQLEALVKVADAQLATFSTVLASKDRDIDQWRGAWQITDQANKEELAGQLEEIVAFARTQRRFMDELQRQTGVPQLPTDRGTGDR